jgi:hypothetical protein
MGFLALAAISKWTFCTCSLMSRFSALAAIFKWGFLHLQPYSNGLSALAAIFKWIFFACEGHDLVVYIFVVVK